VHPGAIIEIKQGARRVRVGITHGNLEDEVCRLLESRVDILLHGHTHAIRDELVGATRVMNPGALHRAARYTALLLDPATGHAEWVEVE
jgi:predicted phosphodiesterase